MYRVLAFAAITGCAGADATTLAAMSTPAIPLRGDGLGLTPGESMAFEIRLGDMVAGEVHLAVGEPGTFEGHRALVVTSSAETSGAMRLMRKMVDQATTTIDMASGRPVAVEMRVVTGDKTTVAHATFTDSSANVVYHRDSDPPRTYHVDFGNQAVHDTLSAMGLMRSWRTVPDGTRTVYVVSGRKLWRVDVRKVGTETIGSPLGNRSATHFAGAAYRTRPNLQPETAKPARSFEVWLSDDADRVPLKLTADTEFGNVTIALTDYNRP